MKMEQVTLTTKYLERHQVAGYLLPRCHCAPDIIVVIPCYDEPDLFDTLLSLKRATLSNCVVEVIVVINSAEHSSKSVVQQNCHTYQTLVNESALWEGNIRLTPILIENIRRKHAGVGYARKVGMDLAVWRFAQMNKEDGIIASLDADTRIEENYFEEITQCFKANPKAYGAIIKFAHDIEGTSFSKDIYEAIVHYELHLRYLNQALKYSGFPYVHHTIGSAFVVRANAYVRHGGMNRRQGGEDFYFLHKLFPHGEFIELNSTCVHPSSRPSHRVPFGTGPQINEFLNTQHLLTYSTDAFLCLKAFFACVPDLYKQSPRFSDSIAPFLQSIDFDEHLEEIRQNSASVNTFVKRFFLFFDAFKVVKYLNFSHQFHFKKSDVTLEAQHLLRLLENDTPCDVESLLHIYRKVEGK